MINKAIQNLRPTSSFSLMGDSYDTLIWQDPNTQPPTLEEVNAEIAILQVQLPKDKCKQKAKSLLAASDWSQLPDVGLANTVDYVTYRGILRGYVTQPQVNPVWPVEPTPVWS